MAVTKLSYPAKENAVQEKINEIIDNMSGTITIDQTYDGTSTNPQSGVAIAGELANYVQASNGNITISNTGSMCSIGYADANTGNQHLMQIGQTIEGINGILFGSLDMTTSNAYMTVLIPNGFILGDMVNNQAATLTVSNNNLAVNGSEVALKSDLSTKQDTLVSGTNIKTINSTSLLGSGNIAVQPTLVSGTNIKTINNTSVLGSGNIVVLQNTATGGSSLTISGTATSSDAATNIGYGSTANSYATALGDSATASGISSVALGSNATVTGFYATALGFDTNAKGFYATALGFNANALGTSAIQIGYGTNSTANTLNIGFYNDITTHYNWQLLDGTTGLIPDARISSNIARTSQIPTVPTNISAFTNDSGYITGITSSNVTTALGYTPSDNTLSNVSSIDSSSAVQTALDGKADTDLSNLSATGKEVIDGAFVSSVRNIIENGTINANTTTSAYSLSSYLPNDSHTYEIFGDITGQTSSTSGQYVTFFVGMSGETAVRVASALTRTSSTMVAAGYFSGFVNSTRAINVTNTGTSKASGVTLRLLGYRRVGTNA